LLTKKYEDGNIQNYNLSVVFIWVYNLVSHIKGEPNAEGI